MFQKTVALSSTEAEHMTLRSVVMRRLLKDLGAEQEKQTVIYDDNLGAMALAKNVGYQSRTNPIDIRYDSVRERVKGGEVELFFQQSKNQLADFLLQGPVIQDSSLFNGSKHHRT
ncbi:Polyprotein [Phytophthora palmivora]|uniref:Polyprotein n=1 Tax=Phytophthora palmivora TaxID=4796 RepID=A0A2P4XYT1_9STRA|nr:Polyprotein [Phytophthora palmivora]